MSELFFSESNFKKEALVKMNQRKGVLQSPPSGNGSNRIKPSKLKHRIQPFAKVPYTILEF